FCRPRDPEAKGLVERANGYLETSFLPGRVFTGPGDFNTQLTAWLQVANRRRHRTIDARPVDRWEADRASMLTLPPVGPPNWWPQTTRLGRDHYIRVDTCDYSVHPRAIGHRITVRTNTESITVTCGDDTVARHVRCWARHQIITDPEHAAAARLLRGQAIQRASRARAAGPIALAPDDLGIEVEQRELGSYDRIFTLIEGGAGKEDT
ncbi:IS21 family transposase, partial [Streptomyces sp. NPDC047718]